MSTTLVLFASYLAVTVGIGLWAARRGRGTEEDYFLASRGLSPISMALSAVSSGRSAWLVVGASATAWRVGLPALWLFPGYIVAEALMFTTLGPRLRERSVAAGTVTLPETLERIACENAGVERTRLPLRQLAAFVTCVFLLTYVSAQLGAGAKTLGAVFEVDGATSGLLVTAAIVLVYTLLGGYRAVVVTDVVQALLMLCGMLVLPFCGLHLVGGWDALWEALRAIDPALLDVGGGWVWMLGGLAIGLGSPGNPHILVRHMSLGDPTKARVALWTGTFWNAVMAAGALLTGLVGRALYPATRDLVDDPEASMKAAGELVFATLSQDVSHQLFFAGFVGLLLATLFAAIMSTCDSQLLVVASSFVRDFRSRREGRGIAASRLAVLVTLVGAVALAYGELPLVDEFVLLAWAALGAAFGPPILFLLYDRRTGPRGAFFGLLAGVATVVVAYALRQKSITIELVWAWLASIVVLVALRRSR